VMLLTTTVEYRRLKLDVAISDEAIAGALYPVLVVLHGGLMPLPIHASHKLVHIPSSTVCFARVDVLAKLNCPIRARSLLRSTLSVYKANLLGLGFL
jgi:hypothetical protein